MRPTISSLKVAQKFGKKHAHILRDIQNLNIPKDFNQSNFGLTSYVDQQGREQPCYDLTRDGFALLAMGFTGKAALQWKIRFLECFNKMETELLKIKEQALLQNLALTQKPLLAQTRRAAAQAALSITPRQQAHFKKVLRYYALGLSKNEIRKLCQIDHKVVTRILTKAQMLGLLEDENHAQQ